MKKLILTGLILFGLVGCYGPAKKNAALNSFYLDRYVQLMDQNETTPKNNQDEIRACRIAWWAQNYYLNGGSLPADIESDVNTYMLRVGK